MCSGDPAVTAKSYCVFLVCFEKCPLGEAGLVLFGSVLIGYVLVGLARPGICWVCLDFGLNGVLVCLEKCIFTHLVRP